MRYTSFNLLPETPSEAAKAAPEDPYRLTPSGSIMLPWPLPVPGGGAGTGITGIVPSFLWIVVRWVEAAGPEAPSNPSSQDHVRVTKPAAATGPRTAREAAREGAGTIKRRAAAKPVTATTRRIG
jgi:hypothetical protein